MHGKDDLIKAHGGYRDLKSFQMSEIVFDGTVKFCERFVDRFSRTTDQMVQAARSGGRTSPKDRRFLEPPRKLN
jgi:hypothetical protein